MYLFLQYSKSELSLQNGQLTHFDRFLISQILILPISKKWILTNFEGVKFEFRSFLEFWNYPLFYFWPISRCDCLHFDQFWRAQIWHLGQIWTFESFQILIFGQFQGVKFPIWTNFGTLIFQFWSKIGFLIKTI